jgi:cyclic dehypoxanthinyl futalosine synthase
LLQGGHHPDLGLDYYTKLFRELKTLYPEIKLHALGPPEVAHICKIGGYSHKHTLSELKSAGMDSMPGAGAEILSDRVRRLISKGKCSGQEWLDIMKVAHSIGLTTSATMMFGHIETLEERFDHLVRIRETQAQKPKGENGFLAFIAWPFMDDGTLLQRVKGINNNVSSDEYLKMVAICRIMLPNIKNIQTSWLTVGAETAQLTLHAGANDMGSIMIEENVVSAAGAPHRFTANTMQECIKEAGFSPQLRTQLYLERDIPKMEEQVIDY